MSPGQQISESFIEITRLREVCVRHGLCIELTPFCFIRAPLASGKSSLKGGRRPTGLNRIQQIVHGQTETGDPIAYFVSV